MKISFKWNGVALLLALAALVLVPAALFAQQDQQSVTLQDVKDRLKQNEKFLQDASKRGKAGDSAGMQVALDNYGRSMNRLNQALSHDQFEGDASDRVDALERVEKATRKHGEVLSDLLTKVHEQARPGIERAMQASQRGRDTALGKLENARTQRDAAAARRQQAAGQAANGGRPSGVGAASKGGPPSGAGSGQPSGGRPGGKPPGKPPGRP